MNAEPQAPALQLAHSAKPVTPRDRFIRLPAVELATGFKKSTLYGWIKEGKFPPPIQIGRASVWPESSIFQWVQDRISEAKK